MYSGVGETGWIIKIIGSLGVGKKVMVIKWNVVGVWYLVRKVKVKEYLIHFEESYQNLLVVWVLEKKAMVMEQKVVGVWYW